MNCLRRIFAPLLLAALSVSARSQTVRYDVPYAIDSTGIYHGDLYRPAEQSAPFPAVLMIHGGSWRSGHKHEMKRLAKDLSGHGYVCFSIDYDVRPHSFPVSWQEGRAAVEFLRSHAAEFGIDPARIAVLGSSAGGEIASLIALEPTGPASDAAHRDVRVQAAVTLNGGYDAHVHAPIHGYILKRYLGDRCERIADVCDDASPVAHVGEVRVPFFVGHGDHDHLIPYMQATTFIQRLNEERNPVTTFVAEGGGHNYWRKRKFYAQNLAAVETFLDKNFHKA